MEGGGRKEDASCNVRFKWRAQNKRKAPRGLDLGKAIAPNKMATEEEIHTNVGISVQYSAAHTSCHNTFGREKETPHTTIQIPGRSDDDDKIYLRGYYVHQ